MRIQFFCCCIELRLAAKGLGYAGMGFSVPMLCLIFIGLAHRAVLIAQHVEVYDLFCTFFILVLFFKFFSDLLLILRSNGNLELPFWLIVNAATILLTFLALTLCFLILNWYLQLYIIIFIGVATCSHLYVWLCVLSLYRGNGQDDEDDISHQNFLEAAVHM